MFTLPHDIVRLFLHHASAKVLYAHATARSVQNDHFIRLSKARLTFHRDESHIDYDYDGQYLQRVIEKRLPNGDGTKITQDGGILIVVEYKGRKRHGTAKRWMMEYADDDSEKEWQLSDMESFSHGKHHGVHEDYTYQTGQRLLRKCVHYESGKLHGPFEQWEVTDAGEYIRTLHCNFQHGQKHGLYETWDQHGILTYSCHYMNDVVQS